MKGFLSYAHADAALFKKMRPHFAALKRGFDLALWTDHQIEAGTVWAKSIEDAIAAADVFVLMISPDFIESDYVNDKEIPAIQARRNTAGALVLPVVVRRCMWQMVADKLQAVPTEDGSLRPVTDWRPQENGCHRATEQMMHALQTHFGRAPKRVDWSVP